eukprot:15342606-Ditylum_brightwellii.AAC.1
MHNSPQSIPFPSSALPTTNVTTLSMIITKATGSPNTMTHQDSSQDTSPTKKLCIDGLKVALQVLFDK